MKSFVFVACALAACGKKEDSDRPASTPAPAPAPGSAEPPATPPTPPAPPTAALSCDKLVPRALIDKRLAGATVDAKPAAGNEIACSYKKAGTMGTIDITFRCNDDVYKPMSETIAMALKQTVGEAKPVEVAGVGKGAVSMLPGQIIFWATNTNCVVTILPGGVGKDPAPFAKELDAALTPDALK
jgi:hypothetical protein